MCHGSTLRVPWTPNIQRKRGTWHLEGRLCVNTLRSGARVYTQRCAPPNFVGVHSPTGDLLECPAAEGGGACTLRREGFVVVWLRGL